MTDDKRKEIREILGRAKWLLLIGGLVILIMPFILTGQYFHERFNFSDIGQIVFLGKMLAENGWTSLSIPKGNSQSYNKDKFSKPKRRGHFTDEFLNDKKE